jgi:hypothetical protein
MTKSKQQATDEFRRMMKWVLLAGVAMVVVALVYLRWMGSWSANAVIATILGVFVSVVLGCGLFALAFFSDKSGYDEDVSSAKPKQSDDE